MGIFSSLWNFQLNLDPLRNLLSSAVNGMPFNLHLTNDIFDSVIPRYTNSLVLSTTICALSYSVWLLIHLVQKSSLEREDPEGKALKRPFTLLAAAVLLSQDFLCATTLFSYEDPRNFLFYNISSLVMCWISQGAVYCSILVFIVFSCVCSPLTGAQRRKDARLFFTLASTSLLWTLLLAVLIPLLSGAATLYMLYTCGCALKSACLVAGYYAVVERQPSPGCALQDKWRPLHSYLAI